MFFPSRFFALLTGAALLFGAAACDSSDSGDEPLPAPSSLAGTSGDGAVALEWDAPDASDLDGYRVYRSKSSFSDASGAERVNSGGLVEETAYSDTGAQNGTTYYYRVTAVGESGEESNLSSEIQKTPFPDPPDEP